MAVPPPVVVAVGVIIHVTVFGIAVNIVAIIVVVAARVRVFVFRGLSLLDGREVFEHVRVARAVEHHVAAGPVVLVVLVGYLVSFGGGGSGTRE